MKKIIYSLLFVITAVCANFVTKNCQKQVLIYMN